MTDIGADDVEHSRVVTGMCGLCASPTTAFDQAVVLGRHEVDYVRCSGCGSVFLPAPHWLEEAYSSAISSLDVGLLERCWQLANVTSALIATQRLRQGTCLDFAGGYGTFTRLMRDRGHDFRHLDPLCANIFAEGLGGELDRRYDLITAYEVLEHLEDPVRTLSPLVALTDLLIVTTQVLPDPPPRVSDWDYYALASGQHITFCSLDGLRALAEALGCELTSSGGLVHVFHRRPLTRLTKALLRHERGAYGLGAVLGEVGRRRGLTLADSHTAAARVDPGS